MSGPGAWGPQERRAAVAVSFDNLGEAADLERGRWPAGAPLGRHDSVTRVLPRVLALLAELELRATFFVEGCNAERYPDALREIAAGGHEVAHHGWRHERWAELDAGKERALLERGAAALGALGLRPDGFRPPGGRLAPATQPALAALGFAYCSPAGRGAGVAGDLAVLPFEWRLIDAFHYLEDFAPLREAALGAPGVLAPDRLRATLSDALDAAVADGELLSILFHPFLADTDERFDAMAAVLRELRARVTGGTVWAAPYREIAAWIRGRPDSRSWTLELDPTER